MLSELDVDLQRDLRVSRDQAYPFLKRKSSHHMGIIKTNIEDIPNHSDNYDAIVSNRRLISNSYQGRNIFHAKDFGESNSILMAFTERAFSQKNVSLACAAFSEPSLKYWSECAEEDIFILEENAGGEIQIVAGSTCYPSRWNPMERLGASLAVLHDPVPHIENIVRMIEAFFRRMKVGEIFFRMNWSVTDDPDWCQPRSVSKLESSLARGLPILDAVFYRLEKQHILRLSESLWVFLINVRQVPVSHFVTDYDLLNAFYDSVTGWSPEMKRYKGWDSYGVQLSNGIKEVLPNETTQR
jgi:hypothetical protein